MAVQYPTQDEQLRRQGENPLIANMPTSSRADRMQAQYNQPVTGPRGTIQPASAGVPQSIRQDSAGIGRMVTGALSLPVAAVREGIGNIGTDIANVGRMAIGGQPEPRPGYPRTAALAQQAGDGAAAFAGANRNLLADTQTALRDATGTRVAASGRTPSIGQDMPAQGQAAAAPAQQAAPASSSQPAQATATPAIAANMPGQGDIPAGNGYTQAGDGIAMRVGADGAPEFTNDAAAVSGARAMPAGGIGGRQVQQSAPGSMVAPDGSRVLASGSNTPDQEFARLGSVANLGNGFGSFSRMQPGDSQLAIERFQRANDIRAQAIQDSRRGQIGEGGGRLTIVRDSSRTPSLQERQLARLDNRLAQTEALRAQSQQGILSGMDERLTNQLNRQRAQQELDIGGIQLAERQRLDGLAAQMADTSLRQDQREAARSAYASLSTPAKDRYILQDTVIASDPNTGPKYGKVAIDVLTGRPVAGGIGDGSLGLPAGVSKEQALSQAKAAIASGAPKDAVNRRLQDIGLDPI